MIIPGRVAIFVKYILLLVLYNFSIEPMNRNVEILLLIIIIVLLFGAGSILGFLSIVFWVIVVTLLITGVIWFVSRIPKALKEGVDEQEKSFRKHPRGAIILVTLGVIFFLSMIIASFIQSNTSDSMPSLENMKSVGNIRVDSGQVEMVPLNSSASAKTIRPATSTPPNSVRNTPNPYSSKPTNMSWALASIVLLDLGSEKTKYIKMFANGTNDLALATHNMALMLDKNPNIAAAILAYIVGKNSQNSSSTIDDLESKIDDLEDKVDDINDALGN